MAKRILVADDDKNNRLFIELCFNKTEYEVVITSDGKEALTKFLQGKFDLVITDLYMPNLNGIQLFKEIRKQNKKTPVIAFTGASFDDDDPEIHDLGFTAFIHKSITQEMLLDTVAKYI